MPDIGELLVQHSLVACLAVFALLAAAGLLLVFQERRRRRVEEDYRLLVHSARSIILRLDAQGRITFLNDYGQTFFCRSPDAVVGRPVVETILPPRAEDGTDVAALVRTVAEGGKNPRELVTDAVACGSRKAKVSWTLHPVLDLGGAAREVLAVGADVTELVRAREESARALAMATAVIESTSSAIVVFDAARRVAAVNSRYKDLFGLPPDWELIFDPAERMQMIADTMRDKSVYIADTWRLLKDMDRVEIAVYELEDGRYVERNAAPFRVAGVTVGRLFSYHDITARRMGEARLERLATTDGLTGCMRRRGRRENSRKLVTMASRWRISAAMTSKSSRCSCWSGPSFRLRSSANRRSFTEVSGLRMEWATPAASLPTRASFSVWRRVSWLSSSCTWVRCMVSSRWRRRRSSTSTSLP